MSCEDDLTRRARAFRDAELVERHGDLERRIAFEVGYDHRPFGCDHGVHGMQLRFTLIGPAGAVQWLVMMPAWTPGNVSAIGTIETDHDASIVPATRGLGDAMAIDLGYHSPRPQYSDQPRRDTCHLLPDGWCYYDGSGLNAVPVLDAFLTHGPHAVWAALGRYYAATFAADEVVP